MRKHLVGICWALVLLSTSAIGAHEVNKAWQLELGMDNISKGESGGLASATFGTLGFERQELTKSSSGIRLGARKNFDLNSGFFTNSGISLSFASFDHEVDMSQIGAKVDRESDSRNLAFEQRFGWTYMLKENIYLRPFMGIGLNLQQTETTSSVQDNNGNTSPEEPKSTITDSFLVPVIGVEAFFFGQYGLQLSYLQSKVSTPAATIVTGGTDIESGFDIIRIINLSFVYSF